MRALLFMADIKQGQAYRRGQRYATSHEVVRLQVSMAEPTLASHLVARQLAA